MLPEKSQIKKRIRAWVVVFLVGLALPALAVKPQPPLKLHLSTAHRPNNQIELTLHATAQMSVPSAELSLRLPESLSLIDGTPKWTGPMAVGEKKTLILLLQPLSTLPSTILAEGTVALPDGGYFTQHSTLALDKGAQPSPPTAIAPIRQKQGGDAILEFSGK